METCDKCGRILYLVDIEVRKSETEYRCKKGVPHLNKTYMCIHCETTKTKGL